MSLGKTNSVKRILTALTLSAVLASPAWSEYTVIGNGTATCGEFSDDHDQYGKQIGVEQWIWGLFSGMNASSRIHGDDPNVGNEHHKALYAAVLKYCRDNPLQNVAYGTLVTYLEIKEKF